MTEIYLPWVYPTSPSAPLTFELLSEGLPEAGNVGFREFPGRLKWWFGRFLVWKVQGLEGSGFEGFRVWGSKVGLKQGFTKARLDKGGKLGGKLGEYPGAKAGPGGATGVLRFKYTYDIYVYDIYV